MYKLSWYQTSNPPCGPSRPTVTNFTSFGTFCVKFYHTSPTSGPQLRAACASRSIYTANSIQIFSIFSLIHSPVWPTKYVLGIGKFSWKTKLKHFESAYQIKTWPTHDHLDRLINKYEKNMIILYTLTMLFF